MMAGWHNPRVVALVIYALLVNLMWFAAASAHRVNTSDVWCTSGADNGASVLPVSGHDDCHAFCGAHAGPAVYDPRPAVEPVSATGLAAMAVTTVAVVAVALPWQARGPPGC